jgi:hypothetical protein
LECLIFVKIKIPFGDAIKDEKIMHSKFFFKDTGIFSYYEGPGVRRSQIDH